MSTNSRNPGLDYGGTWQLWGQGKVPVGIDTTDTDFDTIEKTGGEKKHKLTKSEMPSHTHRTSINMDGNQSMDSYNGYVYTNTAKYYNQSEAAGGDQPHNNLQPYIVCYMWKKIA